MYSISNATEWEAVSLVNLGSKDMVLVVQDISFTSQPSTININNGVVFNGGNYTITLNFNNINGIFKLNGGIIENVYIDCNSNSLNNNESAFINYTTGGSNQYGDIKMCKCLNCNVTTNGGGFACYEFGSISNTSKIEMCLSTAIINGQNSGGYIGSRSKNIELKNCCYEGDINFDNCGGFLGSNCAYNNSTITFDTCFSNGTLNNNYCGGLVASVQNGGTVSIKECISKNIVSSNYSGGFIGNCNDNSTIYIVDSYTIGDVDSAIAGSFIGNIPDTSVNTSTIDIEYCYQAGSITNGSSLIGECGGQCVITCLDCSLNSVTLKAQGSNTVNTNGFYFYTTLSNIENGNMPNTWRNNIWLPVTGNGEYPILKSFRRRDVWSLIYMNYNITPSFKVNVPLDINNLRPNSRLRLKSDSSQVGDLYKIKILNANGLIVRWMDGQTFQDGEYRAYFGPLIQNLEEL